MRFYTVLKLGPHREMTPDGFTIFRNVSISRIGEQIYGPDEGTGIEPGPDGLIHINRAAEEVFRPETLDSGNGKSLVILHPDEDVSPENWRSLTHGVMFNLRRGAGDQSEESVADIFIGSVESLREIDLGLREVSLGYDADYFQTGPGHGEQRNIFINHLALVPAGRCGPKCAFRDHKHNRTGDCSVKNKKSFVDRLLAAVRNKDEEGAKELVKEMDNEEIQGGSGETHIHVHTATGPAAATQADAEEETDPYSKRFKAIEDSVKAICDRMDADKTARDEAAAKAGRENVEAQTQDDDETEEALEDETGTEDAGKAKDSAALVDTFENVKMLAEIIAPGIQIPTFDAKADPKKTFRDCVCGLRRKALGQAVTDAETAEIIETVRGRALDSAQITRMKCGEVRNLFNGVAAIKRNHNNGRLTVDNARTQTTTTDNLTPMQRFKAASKARWADKK